MEEIFVKMEPPDFFEHERFLQSPSTSLENDGQPCLNVKEEPSEEKTEIDDHLLDSFTFESDHPALKNNRDYKKLLQTISILEVQRSKAIRDLDRLCQLQEEALANPIAFVERLQKKENVDIPGPQKLPEIPVIDWSQYSLSGSGRRQQTRFSNNLVKNSFKGKFGGKTGEPKQKPAQPWSAEEQKRLEELLIQFPPEEKEVRRWEKIASCLENRTPIQVASRVQKYFIRLMKSGMPVPGRLPSTAYMKKNKRTLIRQMPSTFMVSVTPPVYMPEVDDFTYQHNNNTTIEEISADCRGDSMSDDDDIPSELKDTPEFKELMVLKKIQKEKLQTTGLVQHLGFKCDRCKAEPIVGTRYHCMECAPPVTVDFCEDCSDSGYECGDHLATHKLEPFLHIGQGFDDHSTYANFLANDCS